MKAFRLLPYSRLSSRRLLDVFFTATLRFTFTVKPLWLHSEQPFPLHFLHFFPGRRAVFFILVNLSPFPATQGVWVFRWPDHRWWLTFDIATWVKKFLTLFSLLRGAWAERNHIPRTEDLAFRCGVAVHCEGVAGWCANLFECFVLLADGSDIRTITERDGGFLWAIFDYDDHCSSLFGVLSFWTVPHTDLACGVSFRRL